MRKGFLALGLAGLALLLSGTPLVLSQMQSPSEEPETPASDNVDSDQLQLEIAMLRAINDMDLSADQLETLHSIVADLRSKRAQMIEAQRSLRDFLVRFEGSREAYRQAVPSREDELSQARSAFQQALQDAIEQAKGTLTIRQGQILQAHLSRHLGQAHGQVEPRAQMESYQPEDRSWREQRQCLTGRLDASMDDLRERVGDMLDRFGLNGRTLEKWKREWQDRIACPPTPDGQRRPESRNFERPQLKFQLNVDRIRDVMTDHLDTLEQVLTDKLSVLQST